MRSRIIRTVVIAVALLLSLSACEMTVRMDTALDADGSGRFTLGIDMDRELRDQLEQSREEPSGLAAVQELFEGLRAKGWAVTTSQPQGGLSWEAARSFADSSEFDAAIAELSTAQSGSTAELTGLELKLDHAVERSFMRTDSTFDGRIDTTGGATMSAETREIVKALGDVVRFEISADLPGAVTEQQGDGTVREGSVVWRPALGTALDFSAKASSLNTGALLMVLVPFLGLLAGGGWLLVGRRRGPAPHEVEQVGAIVTGRTEPRFLAIEPEPIEIDLTVAEQQPDPEPV